MPIGELAVIEIVPSATPQSLTSVLTADVKIGGVLSSITSIGPRLSQPPLAFLTLVSYVPPHKPVNVPPLASQVRPPSFENSYEPDPPVAVMVNVPSQTLQSVGFVEATFVIAGAVGGVIMTGLKPFVLLFRPCVAAACVLATIQVPSAFLTNIL